MSVAKILEVHATFDLEDGRQNYLRNVGKHPTAE
jgi:hypothetical protein